MYQEKKADYGHTLTTGVIPENIILHYTLPKETTMKQIINWR